MPRQILLSYAREDAPVVAEMAADLRALDHEVWLDQDLGGGQDWWDEILARIRWCDAFVPVLSTASLGSRACSDERSYAVALARPILPVAVGDLGPEGLLAVDLARRQRIAYRPGDKPSTLRLLGAVQRLAAAPPLPAVAPAPPPAPMAYLGALRAELDSAAPIEFERQLVLHGLLAAEAEDVDRHPEVAALVKIFLSRREIAAYVWRQLTALQGQLGGPRSVVEAGLEVLPRRDAVPEPVPSPPSAVPTTPEAGVVRDRRGVLELSVFNPNLGRQQELRFDRTSGPSQAANLDGRFLKYYVTLGVERWYGADGVDVVRTDGGSPSLRVEVGGIRVYQEDRPRRR